MQDPGAGISKGLPAAPVRAGQSGQNQAVLSCVYLISSISFFGSLQSPFVANEVREPVSAYVNLRCSRNKSVLHARQNFLYKPFGPSLPEFLEPTWCTR